MPIVVEIVVAVYVVMSLATFVLYGWDKRQASRDGWRVKRESW